MNAADTSLTGKGAVRLIPATTPARSAQWLPAAASSPAIRSRRPLRSPNGCRAACRQVDGVFVQMEDEIASMAAVIGASMGGVKAMTATSGPGFSLKQENIGYAAGAEIPCVIVNVMRGGPSTGMPTRPSQADVMQARWGSHGDYPIIVLAPASVARDLQRDHPRLRSGREMPHAGRAALRPGDRAAFRNCGAQRPAANNIERTWASGPRADYKPYGGAR